eukprot:13699942-Alexandrium_andersonii.AAC.1
MSASLVGSEMCIRDRRKARRRWPTAHALAASQSCRPSQARPAAKRKRSCLLYTSDAADDM